jgi:hypothetical protein
MNWRARPIAASMTDLTRAPDIPRIFFGQNPGPSGFPPPPALACQRFSSSYTECVCVRLLLPSRLIPKRSLSTHLIGPNMLFKLNTLDIMYLKALNVLLVIFSKSKGNLLFGTDHAQLSHLSYSIGQAERCIQAT